MTEQEKYWGCTPVVTEHMGAMLKASREYAKMMSNDDETPAQRAGRAKDFQCGAIWEEGYSKKLGWHTASELPEKPTSKLGRIVILTLDGKLNFNYYVDGWDMSNVKLWCYPPKED